MKSNNILYCIVLLYGIGVITINSLNLHYSDNSDSEKCNICNINNNIFGKIGISMGVLFLIFSLNLISIMNNQIDTPNFFEFMVLSIGPLSFICLNALAIFQLSSEGGYKSNCDRFSSLKFDNCNRFKINIVGINIFINGFGIVLIPLFIVVMVLIGIIILIKICILSQLSFNKNKKDIDIYINDLQVVNINNNMESDNISLPPPYSDNISPPPPYSAIKIIEIEI
jgi:hypothetical protein